MNLQKVSISGLELSQDIVYLQKLDEPIIKTTILFSDKVKKGKP